MKILIATGIFPPQIGGPATYSKLLYDELPKQGIDVEVATFGDYLDKPKIIRHFLYFIELLKKSDGVDVIYALYPVSVGLPALIASQIVKKKCVLRIAGDYAWEQGSQRFGVKDILDVFAGKHQGYAWQVTVLKKIQKYVAQGAFSIVVPSVYLKNIVSLWGINPNKITVVYNGFHVTVSKTLRPTLRKKLNLSGAIIVTAARLVPWKGVSELIDALVLVKKEIPDAKLIVIGDGPEGSALKTKVESLDLSSAVVFTGKLDQKELFSYIKAADVFALNTGYEGLSHQILETMALGTPVITTGIGGNPEVITNGKTGILLRPNDVSAFSRALIDTLSSRAVAYSMALAAKKSVAKFTDEAMLKNIATELKRIHTNG